MAALSAPRYTQQVGDGPILGRTSYPIADNVKLYVGGVAALSGGYLVPGQAGVGLQVVGVVENPNGPIPSTPGTVPSIPGVYDNTVAGHSAGAFQVNVKPCVLPLDNSTGGDAIATANVGQQAFLVDDHTVALTDGNGARSVAGVIMGVDASGQVLVSLGLQDPTSPAYPQFTVEVPVPSLAAIANAQNTVAFTNRFGVPVRLKAVDFVVTTPATTGAKLATLTANNNGVPCTGGVLALTSANCTPTGADVAASALTAGNVIAAGQAVTLVASAVTAFVEGAGVAVLTFG